MRWLMVIALFALAGCAESSPPHEPPMEGEAQVPDEEEAADDANTTSPENIVNETGSGNVVLVDMDWSYTNGAPSGPYGNDVTVVEFEVNQTYSRIETTFERTQSPLELFATNCRIWDAGDEFDQNAFNGDTCTAELASGSTGTWRLSYFVEHTKPGGQHELHVRVVATH